MENIRLTPNQLLELAQGEPVLRWDVEDEARVQFNDEDLKTKQAEIMNQSMSKRFFNLSVGTECDSPYNNIDITMVVTWDHNTHLFMKHGSDCVIESLIDVEIAYNCIIEYLRKHGNPDYINKIINN